ncbi:MAG: hypothetical protein KAR79_02780 [Simkaniaceae bacterium]|nr:hypothetical protein [Simkaniaceae bacterium]
MAAISPISQALVPLTQSPGFTYEVHDDFFYYMSPNGIFEQVDLPGFTKHQIQELFDTTQCKKRCELFEGSDGKVHVTFMQSWEVDPNTTICICIVEDGKLSYTINDEDRDYEIIELGLGVADIFLKYSRMTPRLNHENTIIFEPRSILDPEVILRTNECAITLLCVGIKNDDPTLWEKVGTPCKETDNWYGHAVIALEGISDNGISYIHYFDLMPKGVRFLNNGHGSRWLDYNYKSDTWIRNAVLGQNMETRVKWEIEQQGEEKNPWTWFHQAGGDSQVTPRSLYKKFATRKEYDDFMRDTPPGSNPEYRSLNRLKHTKIYQGPLRNPSYICTGHLDPYKSVSLQCRQESLFQNETDITIRRNPENCITWSRRILTLANITLPAQKRFYTTTKEYFSAQPLSMLMTQINIPKDPLLNTDQSNLFDCTEEIQRLVGPYKWTLTRQSQEFLTTILSKQYFYDLPQKIREQCRGARPLILRVEVKEQGVKEIDLTDICRKTAILDYKQKELSSLLTRKNIWVNSEKSSTFDKLAYISITIFQEIKGNFEYLFAHPNLSEEAQNYLFQIKDEETPSEDDPLEANPASPQESVKNRIKALLSRVGTAPLHLRGISFEELYREEGKLSMLRSSKDMLISYMP